MSVRVDVWSDFVCPFCFAAANSLKAVEATHDMDVHWRSFELRPEGTTIPDWYKERIIQSRPQLKAMIQQLFGVEINPGPLGINSRKALIGAKVAEAHSPEAAEAYHRLTLEAYWLHGRDISDIAVLREIATESGMDADEFEQALNDPAYDSLVTVDVEVARSIGLSGVPALVLEKKYLISGFQPPDDLRAAVDEVMEQEAQ